jgi:hypothetical protein
MPFDEIRTIVFIYFDALSSHFKSMDIVIADKIPTKYELFLKEFDKICSVVSGFNTKEFEKILTSCLTNKTKEELEPEKRSLMKSKRWHQKLMILDLKIPKMMTLLWF